MTLVSQKPNAGGSPDLLKIGLSDGSSHYLKNIYLDCFYGIHPQNSKNSGSSSITIQSVSSLEQGSEISANQEEAFSFSSACFRAERAGMKLIAHAEQTRAGLARKLQKRGHEYSCVSAAIIQLANADMLNDRRYAEHWLSSRLSRKNGKVPGPRRLSAALGNRGIPRDELKAAFDKILDEETELDLLKRFLAKKHRGNVSGFYSLRGLLKYEGFSSHIINRYFEEKDEQE